MYISPEQLGGGPLAFDAGYLGLFHSQELLLAGVVDDRLDSEGVVGVDPQRVLFSLPSRRGRCLERLDENVEVRIASDTYGQ